MRITNNMIVQNTKTNINGNKVSVDGYNTQMTTQKKISRASDDPVIAIRSLRLSTSLSHVNQYLDNNITDARAWLDVTETALNNMKSILTDVRTQCVNGSTDTLTTDDRNTIKNNLEKLVEQIYTEGNADYAGRTVFTGFRTNSSLTFDYDEKNTTYQIDQTFDYKDLKESRYYTGKVTAPELLEKDAATGEITTADCDTEISQNNYDRIRVAYGKTTGFDSLTVSSMEYNFTVTKAQAEATPATPVPVQKVKVDANGDPELDADGKLQYETLQRELVDADGNPLTDVDGNPMVDADGNPLKEDVTVTITTYESQEAWENARGAKTLGDNEAVYISSTGEFVFGEGIANNIKANNAGLATTYTKTGFDAKEARPEYYYDCIKTTAEGTTEFTKEDQTIDYTIATNTNLTVNTQASEVFDTAIARDITELINVVTASLNANAKVDNIKAMMQEERYSDEASQAKLQTYLDAAQKEADYADDNLQKTYSQYITNFDQYLQNVNESITNVGSTLSRLTMTQTRVENQQTTIKELKSSNEDRDISDIIIDYYASYNAYQASLTAASKVNQQTLLNYL